MQFNLLFSLIIFFACLSLKSEEIEFIKKYEFGSEENQEEMFFQVLDTKVGPTGEILILDSGNNCIKKFSSTYKYLGETGKQGQGPGEMMTPLGIEIDSNGNIYLNDSGNRRINVYDNGLKFIKAIRLEIPMTFDRIFIDSDHNLLILRFPKVIGDKYFYKFSLEGKPISSFCDIFHPYAPRLRSEEEIYNYASLVTYLISRANMNGDRTLIAFTHLMPENPYNVYIMNTKGDILRVISKKIKDYNSEKQRESLQALRRQKKPSISDISIHNLHFTREDYLIVQRRHDTVKNGSLVTDEFISDIFSPAGSLIKEDFKTERILSIDNENNVYTVREEENGVVKIVIYSLKITKE